MNSSPIFRDGDRKKIMPNPSLERHKSNSLESSFGSNIFWNKNSYTENDSSFLSENTSSCMEDELSDNDLIEIQTIPPQLGKEANENKNSFGNLNTAKEVYIYETPFTYEQLNIEECLLELDDYLEKMEDSSQNVESNINKSKIVSNDEPDIICPQFKRDTHYRNTISCPFKNQESGMKNYKTLETPSIYATWSKQTKRSSDGKKANKENAEFINQAEQNINMESMQNSPHANELKAPASSENNIASKVENNSLSNPNSVQVLSNDQIFQNLIEQSEIYRSDISDCRPRQIGRRAERCLRLSTTDNNVDQNTDHVNIYNLRPMSAPVSSGITLSEFCSQHPMFFVGSNSSTAQSSCNTSPVSLDSISDSGESMTMSNNMAEVNIANEQNIQHNTVSVDVENFEPPQNSNFNAYWPYNLSRMLALISCTLGLFNVSRFACLTINYGGNFLIQFLILSIIFGIPFLWLQMCLGAKIKSGPIAMWKISPICSGIGISLILTQYFIAIYSSVVVVWLLIYIGDLFMHQSSYPWAHSIRSSFPQHTTNISNNLTESVPDYFNINVLQRLQILKIGGINGVRLHINDRLAFYLAILWTIVFVILCKGLKSLGKILFIVGFLPIGLLAVITGKLLFVVDLRKIQNIFSSSEFDDFFINSKTWSAAAQETFLTWGLLGASIIAISSRTYKSASKFTLRREAVLVVLITIVGLCLSALIGLCTIQILNQFGYIYVPGSYENPEFYSAIYSVKSLPSSEFISFPSKYVPHYSTLIGEVYRRHADMKNVSGYQVLRFVSELLPAAAAISVDNISWIWIAVIFTTLLTFGLSQICVMWKPISNSLGSSTSAVFLSCVTGLLLSIPFATEIGIKLLHYMDILMGGAWFVPVLWAAQIFGVFLIRGRPYNGDDLVNDLKLSGSMSAFLALSWNVLLPIGLLTLAVINYKTSLSNQLYYWRGKSYFSYWSRKVGALIQIAFLLLIPLAAIVQIYRYLTSGPPDILERIQMLYRPLDSNEADCENRNVMNISCRHENQSNNVERQFEDAPPKYTPPPSYTTATGARLAKLFRQSIRYSIRRILRGSERPTIQVQSETQIDRCSSPTIYSSIQHGRHEVTNNNSTERGDIESRSSNQRNRGGCLSLGRKHPVTNRSIWEPDTLSYSFDSYPTRRMTRISNQRPYTAEDVITILRSSTIGRRRFSRPTRSIENLVLNAEPPDISSPEVSDNINRSN